MGAVRINHNDESLIYRVELKPHDESAALYTAPENWLNQHGTGYYTNYWEPIDITKPKSYHAPLCFFFADPQTAFEFKMRWG